jgi:hypothetical protein
MLTLFVDWECSCSWLWAFALLGMVAVEFQPE